jgi:hypothetical protein
MVFKMIRIDRRVSLRGFRRPKTSDHFTSESLPPNLYTTEFFYRPHLYRRIFTAVQGGSLAGFFELDGSFSVSEYRPPIRSKFPFTFPGPAVFFYFPLEG